MSDLLKPPQPTGSSLMDEVNNIQYQAELEKRRGVQVPEIAPPATVEQEIHPDILADKPPEESRDIQITSDDDFLPYLDDITENYDMREQAFQDEQLGRSRQQGEISNEYMRPGRKTIHGIDPSTGEYILNRDTGVPDAEEKYQIGVAKVGSSPFNLEAGYTTDTGIDGLIDVAEGASRSDAGFSGYQRDLDMMQVPPFQQQMAWDEGQRRALQDGIAQKLDTIIANTTPTDVFQDLPDIDAEQLPGVEGWRESAQLVWEAEEGKPFTGTDAQLVDWYIDQMSSFNWKIGVPGINSNGMAYYMTRAMQEGAEYSKALLSLIDTYDRVNTSPGIIGRNILNIVQDPVSYVGVPGGALIGTKVAGKVAQQAMRNALVRFAAAGAGAGTLDTALDAGVSDAMMQTIEMEGGVRDERDYGQTAAMAGVGAVIGLPMGATMGVTLPLAGRATANAIRRMRKNALKSPPRGAMFRQRGAINPDAVVPFRNRGLQDRLSTRRPWGKNPEDTLNNLVGVDIETMGRASPEALRKNVELMEGYSGIRRHPDKNATVAQRADFIKDQIKENLLWLHDQMAPELRDKSKLWYDSARELTERWSQKYGFSESQVAGVIATLSPEKDWYQNVSGAERMMDMFREQQNTLLDKSAQSMGRSLFQKQTKKALQAQLRAAETKGEKRKAKNAIQVWDDWQAVKGKTLAEIDDPMQAGMWMRAFDEANNPQRYRVWSPDGTMLDYARNKSGKESKYAWGYPITLAKAYSIMRDGSRENIHTQIGQGHKVRNFYNNIIAPTSDLGEVTIDTHAVAAGLLEPLGGSAPEVKHNLGGGSGHSNSGIQGTYAIFADAYRDAAAERGVLPREMQSITWEEVRTLFDDVFKTPENRDAIKKYHEEYASGKIEVDELREKIYEYATTGREHLPPDWSRPDSAAPEGYGDSTYRGELGGTDVRVSGRGTASGDSSGGAGDGAGSGGAKVIRR